LGKRGREKMESGIGLEAWPYEKETEMDPDDAEGESGS
jgi:hypothetical protein